jgi:hypothetical protein
MSLLIFISPNFIPSINEQCFFKETLVLGKSSVNVQEVIFSYIGVLQYTL